MFVVPVIHTLNSMRGSDIMRGRVVVVSID
jgi:hypothetical protein